MNKSANRMRLHRWQSLAIIVCMLAALVPAGLIGTVNTALAAGETASNIVTVAGTGTVGYSGDGGVAVNAQLDYPQRVTVSVYGDIYFADYNNHRVRKIDIDGVITTIAGNGSAGFAGDGGSAVSAQLNKPQSVAVDDAGNVYIVDTNNYRIRKVDASGIITTVAGTGVKGYSGDGGPAVLAKLSGMNDVIEDGAGNLYIVDTGNQRIRKVDASGVIMTVAGSGTAGYAGDGGAATSAQLHYPLGIALDGGGNLYIADSDNERIRKVGTNGVITTVAGSGIAGYAGDGSAAVSAQLNAPYGLAIDSVGNLYIADASNHRIRKVNTSGIITTVAGAGCSGVNMGDGGPAVQAKLCAPRGVAVNGAGNLYIADTYNHRIRRVVEFPLLQAHLNSRIMGGYERGFGMLAEYGAPGPQQVYVRRVTDPGNNGSRHFNPITFVKVVDPDGNTAAYQEFTDQADPVQEAVLTIPNGKAGIWRVSFTGGRQGDRLEIGLPDTDIWGIRGEPTLGITETTPQPAYMYLPKTVQNIYTLGYRLTSTPASFTVHDDNDNLLGTTIWNATYGRSELMLNDIEIHADTVWKVTHTGITGQSIAFDGVPGLLAPTREAAMALLGGTQEVEGLLVQGPLQARARAIMYELRDENFDPQLDWTGIDVSDSVEPQMDSLLYGIYGGLSTLKSGLTYQNLLPDNPYYGAFPDGSTLEQLQARPSWESFQNGRYIGSREPGILASLVTADSPVNPAYDNQALINRAVLASLVNVVMMQGDDMFRGRTLESSNIPTISLFFTYPRNADAYMKLKDKVSSEVREVWREGIMALGDKYADNIAFESNQWSHVIIGHLYTYLATGEPRFLGYFERMMDSFLDYYPNRMNHGQHPTGYFLEDNGPDGNYEEMSLISVVEALYLYRDITGANQSLVTKLENAIEKSLTFQSYYYLPMPTGTDYAPYGETLISPTAMNARTATHMASEGYPGEFMAYPEFPIAAARYAMTKEPKYALSAKVKAHDMNSDAATGIVVGYQDNDNYYLFQLHQSGKAQLYKKSAGTLTLVQQANQTFNEDTVYTLKLVWNGSTLTGFVNGVQKLSWIDPSPIHNGAIGARSYNQSFSIDDVLVNGISISIDDFEDGNADGWTAINGSWSVAADGVNLQYPRRLAVDGAGSLYIAESNNNRIRKVDPNGVITTVAGTGTAGFSGDGGSAVSAQLDNPFAVAVDDAGNLYIADSSNHRIRKVDQSGIITTVAGNGSSGFAGDGGQAGLAKLSLPYDVAVDGAGNLYIMDTYNLRVRKVDTNGVITTVAGNSTAGYSGDGGAATSANLNYPRSITLDDSGNIFIGDWSNHRVRKVDTNGVITTVAGTGTAGYSGDGGSAISAKLNSPFGLDVDDIGNLYIVDTYNYRVRRVDPSGVITTVAGTGSNGYAGDGGTAVQATLAGPNDVIADDGHLYIADSGNHRVREVDASGIIRTVAGSGIGGYAGDGWTAASTGVYTNSSSTGEALTVSGKSSLNNLGKAATMPYIANSPDWINGLLAWGIANQDDAFPGDGRMLSGFPALRGAYAESKIAEPAMLPVEHANGTWELPGHLAWKRGNLYGTVFYGIDPTSELSKSGGGPMLLWSEGTGLALASMQSNKKKLIESPADITFTSVYGKDANGKFFYSGNDTSTFDWIVPGSEFEIESTSAKVPGVLRWQYELLEDEVIIQVSLDTDQPVQSAYVNLPFSLYLKNPDNLARPLAQTDGPANGRFVYRIGTSEMEVTWPQGTIATTVKGAASSYGEVLNLRIPLPVDGQPLEFSIKAY